MNLLFTFCILWHTIKMNVYKRIQMYTKNKGDDFMAETFRIAKVMKFIDTLRALRKVEFEHTMVFGNYLKGQLKEIFPNNELHENNDIYKLLDNITKYSYEKDGISFSHPQFSFFQETMFHLGCTHIIDNIIKEMGEFFDLDIPELNKTKVDLEKYNIRSIDTKDYSNTPRKIYIIIGGMGKSFSEQIQEECAQNCLNILMEIIEENEIDRVENGFIVQTPVQNIPNISNELINNNISIYGIIPIE